MSKPQPIDIFSGILVLICLILAAAIGVIYISVGWTPLCDRLGIVTWIIGIIAFLAPLGGSSPNEEP